MNREWADAAKRTAKVQVLRIKDGKWKHPNHIKLQRHYIVDSISKLSDTSRFVGLFHYNELPTDMMAFKATLAEKGVRNHFARNRYTRLAFSMSENCPSLVDLVSGPILLVHDDPDSPNNPFLNDRYGIEVLKKPALALEKMPGFMFLGATIDGQYIDRASFLELSKPKQKSPELELGGTLASLPMYALPKLFTSGQMELSRILEERAKSLEGPTEEDA